MIVVRHAVIAGAVIRIPVDGSIALLPGLGRSLGIGRSTEIAFPFHIDRRGPVMPADAGLNIRDHIVQEGSVGQAGTGFDLQSDPAAFAVDLFHEVTGFPDGGHQTGHHIPGGLADKALAVCHDGQRVIVPGGDAGYITFGIVFHGDLRVDPQHQDAAVSQGYPFCRCCTLAASRQTQHQD